MQSMVILNVNIFMYHIILDNSNQTLQKSVSFDITKVSNRSLGMLLTKPVRINQFIVEYEGKVTSAKEVDLSL